MTKNAKERSTNTAVAILFAVISALAALDIATDIGEGTSFFHIATEAVVVLVGLLGMFLTLRQVRHVYRRAVRLESQAVALDEQLRTSRADADRWRGEVKELVEGLSASIDAQLSRWELTPAEKEVALLLLKGLSLKELAAVRKVSDATARQQARAVYKKSGLAGRNELAAFFLEDLLLPMGDR